MQKNLFSGRGPGVSADYSVSVTHVVAGGLNFPIWVAGRCRAALHSATSRLPDLCAIQHGSQVWEFGQTSRHVEGGASHLRAGTLSGQAISFPPAGRFQFYCSRLCGIFSEGFESRRDRFIVHVCFSPPLPLGKFPLRELGPLRTRQRC